MRLPKLRAGRSASFEALARISKIVTATAVVRSGQQRCAGLAQLVERQFCKLDVAGSIPAAGTINDETPE